MKKLIKDVVVSGISLFLAHTAYTLVTSAVTVSILSGAVAFGVTGYLTIRLVEFFKR